MRRALGRGLDALLPPVPVLDAEAGDTDVESPQAGVSYVAVGTIRPNPSQPRRRFDGEALSELATSIARHGVLQPLLVRRTPDGFELIAGERRLRAATQAGLADVPVIVRDADVMERTEIALIENLQREDLSPLEEASAYQRLIDEFALTQEEIAGRVGKSRPAVANSLRLLGLPDEVKTLLESGAITAGHARAVLSIDGAEAQTRFAREIAQAQVPKAQAERMAASRRAHSSPRAGKRPTAKRTPEDPNLRSVSDRLTSALGTRVRVAPKRRGGTIEIEYYSNDEFDRLLERLLGGRESF